MAKKVLNKTFTKIQGQVCGHPKEDDKSKLGSSAILVLILVESQEIRSYIIKLNPPFQKLHDRDLDSFGGSCN